MAADRYERRHRRTARNVNCVEVMANADFDAVPSLSEAMGLEEPASRDLAATLSPAEASIYVDGQGYVPVPAACPLCGCKTRRAGNASDRRVCCTNPAMHGATRACYWNSTVFGGHRRG